MAMKLKPPPDAYYQRTPTSSSLENSTQRTSSAFELVPHLFFSQVVYPIRRPPVGGTERWTRNDDVLVFYTGSFWDVIRGANRG